MEGISNNRYILNLGFPLNLFFYEVAYVDTRVKTSVDLMHKYGIKYFKPLKVMFHPDFPDINLVVARIKKREEKKWINVFDDLLIICTGTNYRAACENLYTLMKDHIKEE